MNKARHWPSPKGDFGLRAVPVAALLAVAMAVATPCSATVTRVVATEWGPMGRFGGHDYVWVQAELQGTVARDDGTSGQYRVPISLTYPTDGGNGIGFVDLVNAVAFQSFTEETAPLGQRDVAYTGDRIFSDFLRRQGFSYLAVQTSRMVTDELGPDYGLIENGLDGWEITADAARFLRDPSGFESTTVSPPQAAHHVIGFGYSATGRRFRQFAAGGHNNEADGRLVFDGLLIGGDTDCTAFTNIDTFRSLPYRPPEPTFASPVPCDGPLPTDVRVITIATQTDVERWVLGITPDYFRDETPSHRQYELAGIAHLAEPDGRPFRYLGVVNQNPVSLRPVYKAMLLHLVDWIIADIEPPPPLYLDVRAAEDGTLSLALDDDGNALGGIRLPHMRTTLPDGRLAGAPLGVYGGINAPLRDHPELSIAWLGGTFERFSDDEIARRYPTRAAYVALVERAAAALLQGGYILDEDYQAYVRTAEREPLQRVVPDPFAIIAPSR